MTSRLDIPCWSVLAGTIGSYASLDFGRKVERDKLLSNSAISEEQRTYVGEWSLFTFCSYCTLVRDGWVYVHAESSKAEIEEKLGTLVGDHVVEKSCGVDEVLSLSFRSGAILTIFPTQDDGQYVMFAGQKSIEDPDAFMI